jgi:hypothetical protein
MADLAILSTLTVRLAGTATLGQAMLTWLDAVGTWSTCACRRCGLAAG